MKRNTTDCTPSLSLPRTWRRPIDDSWHWSTSFLWVVDWHSQGWCRLRQRSTLPGSPFPETTCANCYGRLPRFCRRSRQASSNEYAGMQSYVRKPSNLKDLKCQQISPTVALPSGCPATPEHCRRFEMAYSILWQLQLLESFIFFIFIQNIFLVAYAHHLLYF